MKGIRRKSKEVINRGDEILEPLLKSDQELSKFVQKQLESKRDRLIKAVFSKSYSELTESDLEAFSTNITRRMYLLKKFFPPKLAILIKSILAHPNLSTLDRNVDHLLLRTSSLLLSYSTLTSTSS